VLPSETELVAKYAVSKVVVRESVKALVGMRMVTVKQGRRTVVLDESEWDVLSPVVQDVYKLEGRAQELLGQFYEARMILEPAAASLAAGCPNDQRVSEIVALADRMRQVASSSRNVSTFLAADRDFHDAIVRAVGNVAVRSVMRALHNSAADTWNDDTSVRPSELALVADQHSRIASAIVAKDGEAARQAMLDHLSWARDSGVPRAGRRRSRR
jgi:DNA-binding FadR family transcriptional regulator